MKMREFTSSMNPSWRALRADLADRERQLQQRPVIAVERNLSETIEQLQRELGEKQQILSSQEVTFQRSSSEIADTARADRPT